MSTGNRELGNADGGGFIANYGIFALYGGAACAWLWASEVKMTTLAMYGSVAVVGWIAMMYSQQDMILYARDARIPKSPSDNHPAQFRSPAPWKMPYDAVRIPSADVGDGEGPAEVACWFIKSPRVAATEEAGDDLAAVATTTIIHFHGNAGNIGFKTPETAALSAHI